MSFLIHKLNRSNSCDEYKKLIQFELKTISVHREWWQNPVKGSDLHPKDHKLHIFTDTLNVVQGDHLEQDSVKGLLSHGDKRLHINVLELKVVFLALKWFDNQCQNLTVLVATDNSTVVAFVNKQGGTHSVEMCAILGQIMTNIIMSS